jgi:TatD DNase family protein
MDLIDTHCHVHAAQAHLDKSDFTAKKWREAGETNPERLIDGAAKAGVTKLICVGTDLADSSVAVDFVAKHPNCWASVGVHPHGAQAFLEQPTAATVLAELCERFNPSQKVVAVGECGLDYFYEHSSRDAQREVLEQQLQMALDYKLPVIFHVREAYGDFWPIFDNFQGTGGVLHSFTSSRAELDKALSRGLFIGLNGIMTFTKDPEQITMVKSVPLGRLLVETDAPYLTPKPFRGKICKPEYVRDTARFLAELRGETLEEFTEATTANAIKLFNLH